MMLASLDTLTTAPELLNFFMSTPRLEAAARETHEAWRAAKSVALDNPADPYRGYGPVRVKLRDLPPKEQAKWPGVDLDADVFHPLDVAYDELGQDIQSKNVLPMVVLCTGLGDLILQPGSELCSLETRLRSFISGADGQLTSLLARLQHLAFVASEVRSGARPYGDTPRSDLRLFGELSKPVQELDVTTLIPAAKWLLGRITDPNYLVWAFGVIEGERLAIGGEARAYQAVLNHPDFLALKNQQPGKIDPTEPDFWAEAMTLLVRIAPQVQRCWYEGQDADGFYILGVMLSDKSAATIDQLGSALAIIETRCGLSLTLGTHNIMQASPFAGRARQYFDELPPDCPTCQVPWAYCQSRLHYDDARLAARR